MFYAIIAILLLMYYIFIAPKTIKNTMNMISVVGIIAFLMVLAGMTLFGSYSHHLRFLLESV